MPVVWIVKLYRPLKYTGQPCFSKDNMCIVHYKKYPITIGRQRIWISSVGNSTRWLPKTAPRPTQAAHSPQSYSFRITGLGFSRHAGRFKGHRNPSTNNKDPSVLVLELKLGKETTHDGHWPNTEGPRPLLNLFWELFGRTYPERHLLTTITDNPWSFPNSITLD